MNGSCFQLIFKHRHQVHSVVLLARAGGRPILPEKTYKQIFLNIRDIHTFNKNLLEELEDRMAEWSVTTLAPVYYKFNSHRDPNLTTISDILVSRADCFLKVRYNVNIKIILTISA